MRARHEHFIGGRWVPPAGGDYFEGVNPSNGEPLGRYARGNAADIDRAVRSAQAAQEEWAAVDAFRRGQVLHRVAQLLREHKARLAMLDSLDVGKPLDSALSDVETCARYFEFYAGLADKIHGETIPAPGSHLVYTRREPYGVIGQITAWNAPMGQTGRSAAPAFAAGNAIVIKPAEQTNLSIFELVALCIEAGMPAGAFNVVTGFGSEAGQALVDHPLVRKVNFTGSADTGKLVMAAAAKRIVPVSLELGGKSPFIVFADADIEAAAKSAAFTLSRNAGQVCSAGTRHLVERSIAPRFVERFIHHLKAVTIGPGPDSPEMGPVVSQEQLDRILGYVALGQAEGATLACGGRRLTEGALAQGFFVEPTVFTGVDNRMRIAQEEIFGPVACLIPFDDEADAIRLANDIAYGLSSYVWTENIGRAHRVAAAVEAGMCFVNSQNVRDLRQPFGGTKASGTGREGGTW
ncbi:MAG: aldehyde dehydrogenase, partial [Comamonadaceae bacterium]